MSRPLYRVFLLTLTVFFVLSGHMAQSAQGESLMVKGVTVDISADSALSARNKAFAEARRKAYQQLAAQYMSAEDLAHLSIPNDQVLSSMVKDFEIVNEKMTSRRYAGAFDVRFNPAVRHSFQTQSAAPVVDDVQIVTLPHETSPASSVVPGTISQVPPVITGGEDPVDDYIYSPARGNVISSPAVSASMPAVQPQVSAPRPTLILPWYGPRGRQTLWGQTNPWRDAWEASTNLSRDKSLPILLPVGDVEDLRDYAPPQPLSHQGSIDALLKRYKASDAILALAEPAEGGALIVSLYRYENGSPVSMGRFGVDAGSGTDSMKQAVERTLASMRAFSSSGPGAGAPQATPASVSPYTTTTVAPVPTTPNAMYFVAQARFSGLQQWVAMRNALATTPGIQGVDVQSISPSQAQVQFAYNGDHGGLSALLAQKGLQLSPLSSSATPTVPGAMVPQYQLTPIRSY